MLSLILFFTLAADSQVGGRTSPDGTEQIQIDLPESEHIKNVGGRDGAGLCVFTSVEHSGRWQNVESVVGFQKKMTAEPGGGYPSKLEKMMQKYCSGAQFLQYEGSDPSLIKMALATGRMPAVTYGYSPRYGGKIAHMVNISHLTDKWAAILDNNFPGEQKYEWMSPDEFKKRWVSGGGGWAVVLLAPPPPPIPANESSKQETVYAARGGGKWGSAGCPSVDGDSTMKTNSNYEWKEFSDGEKDQIALYQGSQQVGIYSRFGKYFRFLQPDGTFGPRQDKAPVDVPIQFQTSFEQINFFFGVDRSKLDNTEKFFLDGREINKTKAYQILQEGNTLSDDRSKLRLTVVGTPEECRQVINDLNGNPDLKSWSDQCLVQCYRPTDWAVAKVGFAPGSPRIVVQSGPDKTGSGVVLHSQGDYSGGAKELAQALRKVRPDYDPKKDPDKRKDDSIVGGGGLSFILMVAAGIAAFLGMPWLASLIKNAGGALVMLRPYQKTTKTKRRRKQTKRS